MEGMFVAVAAASAGYGQFDYEGTAGHGGIVPEFAAKRAHEGARKVQPQPR